jgi:hypothetical protein
MAYATICHSFTLLYFRTGGDFGWQNEPFLFYLINITGKKIQENLKFLPPPQKTRTNRTNISHRNVILPESSQRKLNVSGYSGMFSFVNLVFFYDLHTQMHECPHKCTGTHARTDVH